MTKSGLLERTSLCPNCLPVVQLTEAVNQSSRRLWSCWNWGCKRMKPHIVWHKCRLRINWKMYPPQCKLFRAPVTSYSGNFSNANVELQWSDQGRESRAVFYWSAVCDLFNTCQFGLCNNFLLAVTSGIFSGVTGNLGMLVFIEKNMRLWHSF